MRDFALIGRRCRRRSFTWAELRAATNRVANGLRGLGLQEGERVFVLAGPVPELYLTVLGALKAKCVVSTLFSAFAPEPIATRLERGEATAPVTTEALYLRKVAGLRDRLPNLRHVVFVGEEGAVTGVSDTHAWSRLMAAASVDFVIPPSAPEDMALLHFTRGTTGRPKGAVHVHDAVVMLAMTGLMKLDLHADDIFWCTSDPGWVTGTSCGIIAPLVNGVTTLVGEAEFDATTWYDVLEKERVSVWYTAPTAIRMMMKLGAEPPAARSPHYASRPASASR